MNRRTGLLLIVTLLAFGQTGREAYRDAYRIWRQTDPTLERDAATKGPALGADADRVANEAAKYGAARAAFFTERAAAQDRQLAWLAAKLPDMIDVPDGAADVIAAETKAVKRGIDTFAGDPDPAMQQLRGMLERENAALAALSAAIADRRKVTDSARSADAAAEKVLLVAANAGREMIVGLRQSAQASARETTAWADYYRVLSDGARGVIPAPVSSTPSSPPPATERRPTFTTLQLARYVGGWTYPIVNGLFHGPEPVSIDLDVHEDNGHIQGTLLGRFKVPGDPEVHFEFSGEFKNAKSQVFALETNDGAKGTLELIPGPAFNLLEVNFHADPAPGKIREGNFVLVKK